ncbi:hypothetical protein ACFV0O_20070 [Kitasatospora sp. NPDC059577]|uniref:hypothetical protein n=1 Tax=Kitasatospora sp. NPDC059577 TaxID=3346873 RepID=UPI00367532C8
MTTARHSHETPPEEFTTMKDDTFRNTGTEDTAVVAGTEVDEEISDGDLDAIGGGNSRTTSHR